MYLRNDLSTQTRIKYALIRTLIRSILVSNVMKHRPQLRVNKGRLDPLKLSCSIKTPATCVQHPSNTFSNSKSISEQAYNKGIHATIQI
jgi:hypothetical protein